MNFAKYTILISATFVVTEAFCQASYPNQPKRFIAPFTSGTSSEVTALAIAQKISIPIGQPVLVENRSGTNGGIGMQAVARSKPDGYTLAVGIVSITFVPPIISKNTPVATMANTPLLLTVVSDVPFNNLADVTAAARKAPGTMTYGNSAGLYRIAMEAVNYQAGIDLLGIPFNGSPQAATELLAGRLTVNPEALGVAIQRRCHCQISYLG